MQYTTYRGDFMIIYKDILKKLADHGWTTYRLIKEKKLSNGAIVNIRANKPLRTTTIDTICDLLDCQPGDLLEHKKDQA